MGVSGQECWPWARPSGREAESIGAAVRALGDGVLATARWSDGLEAVLAQSGEVDEEVEGLRGKVLELCDRGEHRFVI